MKHLRLILLLVFTVLALTLVVGLDLHAQSTAALTPAPDAPSATPAATTPLLAPADQKFKKWTASKGMVHVYPKPSTRPAFMHDEHYVDEQTIKVLEIVPGHNKLSWLKVLTPSNQIGYVFSGEARPANISRSGKLVQSPTIDD